MSIDQACACGECTAADLPVTPFEALRARHGMLLGEDDFRALMGHPRGKLMLHSAWLHGTGVVWGFDVRLDGLLSLVVRPGLAVDGLGRELALDASAAVDLRDWVRRYHHPPTQDGCVTGTVPACLVVEFGCTTARPVPTLADPCDVTRTHDTASRILEGARISLVPGRCPSCPPYREGGVPYHRLRVLFGLDRAGRDDPAGRAAAQARAEIAELPERERAAAFCRAMRVLAARDAVDLAPACEVGTDAPSRFPVAETDAAVVLACVELDVRDADGCSTIERVRVDESCRCVLLPTQTLTELLCAAGSGLLCDEDDEKHDHDEDDDEHGHHQDDDEHGHHQDGDHHPEPGHGHHHGGRPRRGHHGGDHDEGPRVHADDVTWDEQERCYFVPVSGELVAGSVRRAVSVTSLSARGWTEEDVESVTYDPQGRRIVVRLAGRPLNSVVRLVVRGTGPAPVFGVDPPAPLAGIRGGPPAGRHDGRDAVVTLTDALREREGS